jgi:hypothetical protein
MIFTHCNGWTAAPPGASDGIFYTHNHFEQTNRTPRRVTCRTPIRFENRFLPGKSHDEHARDGPGMEGESGQIQSFNYLMNRSKLCTTTDFAYGDSRLGEHTERKLHVVFM